MTRCCLCTFVCLLLSVGFVRADEKTDALAVAQPLLDALVKKDYAAAEKSFSDEVRKALPQDKLRAIWEGLLSQVGPFQKLHSSKVELRGPAMIVTLTCQFEKAALDMDVTLEENQVHGFFFRVNAGLAYKAPPYVKLDAFREVEVLLNPGVWELPGTLSLPKGTGPFPGVVLVHGSGPHDREETIGPNLPFRDLAGGLASKGIAVLRYEKRTKQYNYKLMKQNIAVTLKEEVLDDAVAAAALLRARPEIDPKQIYILGHSLGANVAPLIAERDNQLAGLILLAGNTRRLPQLLVEQLEYLGSLSEKPSEEEKKQLEAIKKEMERVNDPKLEEKTLPSERIMGASAAYWLLMRNYEAAKAAAKLKLPLLILQGERDYQVTTVDFEGWKKELQGRDNVRYQLYPKLNHLFMAGEGEGKSKPAEYAIPGHVAAVVIDDVAGWIKKH